MQSGAAAVAPFVAGRAHALDSADRSPCPPAACAVTFHPDEKDEIERVQHEIDTKLAVPFSDNDALSNVYEEIVANSAPRRARQVEILRDELMPNTYVMVICRVCHGYAPVEVSAGSDERAASRGSTWWRFRIGTDGRLDSSTVKTIVYKARMHCGHFKSTPAVQHRRCLERKTGLNLLPDHLRAATRRVDRRARRVKKQQRSDAASLDGVEDDAALCQRRKKKIAKLGDKNDPDIVVPPTPRLQIFDVNNNAWVDIKRDRGRSIRYHRLRRRLEQVLEKYQGELRSTPMYLDTERCDDTVDQQDNERSLSVETFDNNLEFAWPHEVEAVTRNVEPLSEAYPHTDASPQIPRLVSFESCTASPAIPCVAQKAERPLLRGEEVMDLMTLLLSRSFIDKLPVTRAADVHALGDMKDQLSRRITWLRADQEDSLERARVRHSLRLAILFVAHQLWTPSRMRRFLDRLVPILNSEADVDEVGGPIIDASKWSGWIRKALELSDGDTHSQELSEADNLRVHQEIAMENDVFTGRHRTRTTVSAVLEAGWPEKWANVVRVANYFVHKFEIAGTSKTIGDEECRGLVVEARSLPDVGAYIGAHLVRSLVGVYGLSIPCHAWGAFTMSDTSVGDMLERIRPLGKNSSVCLPNTGCYNCRITNCRTPNFCCYAGLLTPHDLANELASRIPPDSPSHKFFAPGSPDHCDAGALALVLCETHSCCALIERHREFHPEWRYDKFRRALQDTPEDWARIVRRVQIEEYDLDFFNPDIVYHPAHKIVLVTMVAKRQHDVQVSRLKPPRVFEPRPKFRVCRPKEHGGFAEKTDPNNTGQEFAWTSPSSVSTEELRARGDTGDTGTMALLPPHAGTVPMTPPPLALVPPEAVMCGSHVGQECSPEWSQELLKATKRERKFVPTLVRKKLEMTQLQHKFTSPEIVAVPTRSFVI